MAATEMKRIRISVPTNDKDVLAWLSHQQSVSLSIRELIRFAVSAYGTGDYFSSGRDRMGYGPVETVPSASPRPAKETAKEEEEAPAVMPKEPEMVPAAPSADDNDARLKILQMQGLLNK